jgi:formylglycine-generating enzyme required for sulfatase activity
MNGGSRLTLLTLLLGIIACPTLGFSAAPTQLKSQKVEIKCAEGQRTLSNRERVDLELLLLPAGKITLKHKGRPDEEHTIKPIWIGRYETRWDQYEVFWAGLDLTAKDVLRLSGERFNVRTERPEVFPWDGTTPDGKAFRSPSNDNYPANCVHHQAAKRYCVWLSKYSGKKFRLPTEAEWEYACRAGGPPVKLDAKALEDVAWFKDNSGGQPHAVGKKKPNAWGFYDMLGNVGEYVVRDPKEDKGLLAGGSWRDEAKNVWSGGRESYSKEWQKNDPQDPPSDSWLYWGAHHVGFRVVMEE